MRIAIDARFYRSSTAGIGRYTRALIRELIKLDPKNQYTIFITPEDEKEYDEENQKSQPEADRPLDEKIKNFHKVAVPITHYTLSEQTKFLDILKKGKFDLVHFTNFNHPIFYPGKFIITVHDLTLMLYPFGRQKSLLKQIAFRKVMKNAVNKSQKIIAISQATKNDLIKHLKADPDKINVIYEGIDPAYQQEIKNLPAGRQGLKLKIKNLTNKYNINKPYLLFVSQWRPHKGLPELIEAFEILKKDNKNKNLKLVVTGKPDPGFSEIPFIIHNSLFSNDIITPGFVPDEDLPLIYSNANVFVFPSHYEGFGLPPLEAMACGVPVISSNASCMPEILGDAAIYFDPNKPEDITDKINTVLMDKTLQKKMIEKGFQQVKKYSWNKMAQETLQVYEEVLK